MATHFIDNLINQTSVPVLDQMMQFAAARHELIVHNIANIDTPGYRALDLDVKEFQRAMADAIDSRRRGRPLQLDGRGMKTDAAGRLVFQPEAAEGHNIRFNDQGNRNVEKQMSALAENTLTFNLAAELLRGQFEGLKKAIRQRV